MRRNNRARGGNRGNRMGNRGSSNQNSNSGGSRPMMGSSGSMMDRDQLQLRELDLELALLKRKREMIEEQHNMLVTDSRSFNRGGGNQFGFNQQSQSFGQSLEPARNNSRRGRGGGGGGGGFSSAQAVKRPAIDPWDNSAPSAKRFSGPTRRRPNQSFREPAPARPAQTGAGAGGGGPSRANDKPPGRGRNNFRNRVNKPKQASAPNNLNAQPVAERKNLVEKAAAAELVVSKPIVYVLEADRPVHPKMVGRLELALGSVLREMREAFGSQPEHASSFNPGMRQRSLKQAIRDRIRQVMLGQPVGVNAEIVATYRKTFPKETDLELLNQVVESNQPTSELAIRLLHQANPERYFKNNFSRLLSVSLTEMFERLKMLYNQENETKKPLHEIINNMMNDLEKSIPEEEKKALLETAAKGTDEGTKTEIKSSNQEGKEVTEEASKEGTSADAVEDTPTESEAKTDDSAAAKSEDAAKSQETTTDASTNDEELLYFTRFYQKLIESYLRKTLPSLLPKYKEYIADIINADEAYKKTEAYLIRTTNEKAQQFLEKVNRRESTSENTDKNTPVTSKTSPPKAERPKSERLQYFVKCVGRPVLPRKKIMKVFLDSFEPTLIKKHRNIHNILFISFDKKENYDNILAHHGHTLDSKKLDIKPSERINKNKGQKEDDGDQTQDQSANLDESMVSEANTDLTITESLDEQIDDLLTSINDGEETKENGGDTAAGNNAEEVTDEDVPDENTEENTNIEANDAQNDDQQDQNVDQQDQNDNKQNENESEQVEKTEVKAEQPKQEAAKPTRASARKAAPTAATSTPTAVKTRRASKLPQN